jgi:predicted RNA binding protein YcfA (HicA-like mRNA interferase family)
MRVETNSRKLIQMLQADGWTLASIEGDHHNFRHPTKRGKVTITHPRKDMPKGTVLSIYRQAGWR